ncbi:hypothetical protein [Altericroceibacterium endophyticum]|uniref:Uncharacterized protein n=1 Tax=Altericroceibacterium endophyticum TaxID=1808508 RepID=A0A6I4T7W9_9SPHN|nr:hypothetical protein [Altericroceibacterium endophyticum]MXO66093.1 hypothetical protein [Altericroceibacterium endophyticum]
MKKITKALIGTAVAGAMALSSTSPALARDRHDDGIGAGEIIAGALIIGGIAAIASSAGKNDRYDHDYRRGYGRDYRGDYRRGYDRRYYRTSGRDAVEQCVYAAERKASRYSRGRADVTQIRDVDSRRNGFRVKGRIAVDQRSGNWRYSRGGYDEGRFTCVVRRGRVVDVNFRGLRGL